MTQKTVNDLAYIIIGCAIEVHRVLGPGLLESIYEECMVEEMRLKGLEVYTQQCVPVHYKGKVLRQPLRLDILVNNLIIVELKSIEFVLRVHRAQLLSYMRLSEKPKGLLINFFTDNISKSVIPLVNHYFSALPPA